MSDEYDDTDSSNDSDGIRNLRKQYEEANKELKQLRKEREDRLAAERQGSVREHLKARGVNESIADLYHGDDVSADAVGKWVEQYGFAAPVQETPDPNAEAADRVNNASFGNQTETYTASSGRVVGNPEEIARNLANLPYEELQRLGYMPKDNQLKGIRRPSKDF